MNEKKKLNKQTIIFIIALVFSVAIILGVFIPIILDGKSDHGEVIAMDEEGVVFKTIHVDDLDINPGCKKTYQTELSCNATGEYCFSFDFIEKAEGKLKNYINITIKLDERIIYSGSFLELLENEESIVINTILDHDKYSYLTFCYEMPEEIGNEAQGATADFDIKITIERI